MGSFEEHWPELQKGLQRNLARRGVPPWKADDVIQETGLRLFRCWENVDPERSPFGLALRIANNLMWDEARKHRGREILGEVPEQPAIHDVEELSLARMELHRAKKLLDRLNPNHRSVLLAEVGAETVEDRNSAATKMVRMRARKRLSNLMSNASSFGFLPLGLREMARRFSDFTRRNLTISEQASAVGVAAVSVVAAVVVLGVPSEAPASVPDLVLRQVPSTRSLASVELASARKAIDLSLAEAAPQQASGARQTKGSVVVDQPASGDYDVAVPEGGPADGGATFGVVPDEDENWSPSLPDCHQDLDPTHGSVDVGCYVDGPGDDVNVGTELTIRP
jgi:DNA-directed RNA polymerase specialized sigma24 family protein